MKVIYLREILREAKKEFINLLKPLKQAEEVDAYRFYFCNLVFKKLKTEIMPYSNSMVKYGRREVFINFRKWDDVEMLLTKQFWSIVYNMELKIREKYKKQ